MFNFFVRRHNYLFVLLKYLFLVAEINNRELKKINFKNIMQNIVKCDPALNILSYEREWYNSNLIWMHGLIPIVFFSFEFECT